MDSAVTKRGRPSKPFIARQQAHWGEIIQGPVRFEERVVTALITMPRLDRQTVAEFTPAEGTELSVTPSYALKALKGVRMYLDSLGLFSMGGHLRLRSNIRVGCGSGSSTCDIVAAMKAVAVAFRVVPHPMELQTLCWQIERASDPLALGASAPVLYASRCGKLIKRYAHNLPDLICLGFDTASTKMVSTEELAARESYSERDIEQFSEVLILAERGIQDGSAALLADAATESARLNQERLPIDSFGQILEASYEVGALGISSSHSGTVAAALFSPDVQFLADRLEELQRHLSGFGCSDVGMFTVGKKAAQLMPRQAAMTRTAM
jgi:uncharacterized protein involved in propanediol utilization